ncbi:MAG TPA: coniferyl aldehyde dehydrogenase [Beijerinckiaceae bacterium]|nr:coniferyl aldehyde dehydrogenase [Beijerinckiaceae bacterium]
MNYHAADQTTAASLRAALEIQRRAYFAQPVPTLAERRSDLDALARFVKENRQALIEAISADYGHRSHHETLLTEIGPVLAGIRFARRNLRKWMKPQRRHVDRLSYGLASNTVVPQPLGVVGVIVPWNFPLNLSLVPLTYIFAAGNRAMVKMSENSRNLALLMIERMPNYFPPEKLRFFDETGGIGIEFSKLPFDHLLFTGSGTTGRAVMAAAAQNLCPVTLELGGKAPAIICDDFDLKLAAERILFVKYLNAGQICTTVDHVYVPHDKVKAFIEHARAIVPRRYAGIDSPDLTSIIDRRAYERLKQGLSEAQARGATVIALTPGKAFDDEKHRIAPHLVTDAPADCQLMQREIFGPVLPVIGYRDVEEVIRAINSGARPLAIYPFSNQGPVIDRLIERVMSGGVTVNDALMHVGQDDLPFGGVGESGMGHYHGHEGFNTFSKLRPVFRQTRFASTMLLMPPFGKLADRLLSFLTR